MSPKGRPEGESSRSASAWTEVRWTRARSTCVPCTVDVAQTVESLHAHVDLHGVQVGPGDAVLVHGAPAAVGYGERIVCERVATVTRAGALRALWTRLTSRFELTLLYEVSFSPGPAHAARARRPR